MILPVTSGFLWYGNYFQPCKYHGPMSRNWRELGQRICEIASPGPTAGACSRRWVGGTLGGVNMVGENGGKIGSALDAVHQDLEDLTFFLERCMFLS